MESRLLVTTALLCTGAANSHSAASSSSPRSARSGSAAGADSPTVLNIGSSTQLFVDDLLVGSMSSGLKRSMHSPDCGRVAVTADAPWELNYTMGMGGTSVILDDGKLRLWYSVRNSTLGCGFGDQPPCNASLPGQPNYEASAGNIYIGYAESVDGGLSFTKPLMHKYSVRGSTANNFVAIASPGSNCLSIFIDPNEPRGSPRRYRGVSSSLAMASPDGLNWTTIGAYDPAATIPGGTGGTGDRLNNGKGDFDTVGFIFWDPPANCYSFYTRYNRFDQNWGGPPGAEGGRAVRRARSFRLGEMNGSVGEWTNQSVVMGADALDTSTHTYGIMDGGPVDYYGATVWYVDLGAGFGTYFMAAVRFWHWGWGYGAINQFGYGANQPLTGTKDIVLAASRDGEHFSFVDRSAWLGPGLEGSAGSRAVWLAPPGPIHIGNEELYFVSRNNANEYNTNGVSIDPASPHGEWEAEIGVGKLRLNGLVSLDAAYTSVSNASILTTKPLIFSGSKLLLNLNAGGGGSLYIELHLGSHASGPSLLTSNFLTHNGVDLEAAFHSSANASASTNKTAIAALAGRPIVLVMHMQDCKLYGFRFAA